MLTLAVLVAMAQPVLTLSAEKSSILIGEPAVFTVKWTSEERVSVRLGEEEVQIDAGQGFQRHVEASRGRGTVVTGLSELLPGAPRYTEQVIAVTETERGDLAFAFSTSGSFRVRIVYGSVTSNTALITVSAPVGVDEDFFNRFLAPDPQLLTEAVVLGGDLERRFRDVIASNPQSVYLRRPLLIMSEVDFSNAVTSAERAAIIDRLQSLDLDQSAFAAAARLALARWVDEALGHQQALARFEEVVRQHPATIQAVEARLWLAQRGGTPLSLSLSAVPPALWPPNNKLVPVTVTIEVAGGSGVVETRLQSITCDDGCDPARDIAEALYATPDREFRLRATRRGEGTGRTYSITYEATDAAGNKATAQAKVRVPHNRGR